LFTNNAVPYIFEFVVLESSSQTDDVITVLPHQGKVKGKKKVKLFLSMPSRHIGQKEV
jgi:hypothetical protein